MEAADERLQVISTRLEITSKAIELQMQLASWVSTDGTCGHRSLAKNNVF
jgi:hypothetical protein